MQSVYSTPSKICRKNTENHGMQADSTVAMIATRKARGAKAGMGRLLGVDSLRRMLHDKILPSKHDVDMLLIRTVELLRSLGFVLYLYVVPVMEGAPQSLGNIIFV